MDMSDSTKDTFGEKENPASGKGEKPRRRRSSQEEKELLTELLMGLSAAEDTPPPSAGRQLENLVAAIPRISPREMDQKLHELGYRGQERARRAVTLMAYRHISRLRWIYLDKKPPHTIGTKQNLLLMGPTGSGKTFLIETLFGGILKLPTVIVDVTPFSETGYVGQDPNNILTRLYHAADRDPELAQIGIIALDEFDKLASNQNNAVFAGAGTTKDITGMGVQRELLKMLEAAEVTAPVEMTHSSYVETVTINTRDIAFIAIGAFSGFASIVNRFRSGKVSGFFQSAAERRRLDETAIAVELEPEEVENVAYFQTYGFLPELIARFHRIIPFAPLDRNVLREILLDNFLRKAIEEFALEKIELRVPDEVVDHLVTAAIKRETGARGLNAFLFTFLEEQAYQWFGSGEEKTVELFMEGDRIRARAV